MNKDIVFKCIQCNTIEITKASDPNKDGVPCKQCGGYRNQLGYVMDIISNPVNIGVDNVPYLSKDTGRIEVIRKCNVVECAAVDISKETPEKEMIEVTTFGGEKSYIEIGYKEDNG
jgi:DNA-directed RNA polymerase subunit RPC12/RpoP